MVRVVNQCPAFSHQVDFKVFLGVHGKISAQTYIYYPYILQLKLYFCSFFVLEGLYDSDAVWKSFWLHFYDQIDLRVSLWLRAGMRVLSECATFKTSELRWRFLFGCLYYMNWDLLSKELLPLSRFSVILGHFFATIG